MLDIKPTRLDFHNLTLYVRREFGEDILARVIKNRIQQTDKKVFLWVGLRSPHDLRILKSFPNNSLVYVTVGMRERYRRLKARGQNSDDQTKTWTEFQKDCARSTERTIRSFRKAADLVVENRDDQLSHSQKLLFKFVIDRFRS